MNRTLLLLCEYPTLNGGEQSLLATLPSVVSAGWQVRALAPSQGPLAEAFAQAGVEVVPFSCHSPDGARLAQEVLREQLTRQLRQHSPALLHANSLAMARLSGPVAAALQVPSIGHLRDIIKLSATAIADINQHSRLLAVSAATRAFHVAAGFDPDRTVVNYNGVDTARFRPRARSGWLHQELGLPLDTPLVGCVGQIVIRKGQDLLAAAARQLAGEFPDLHYVLIGDRYSEKAEAVAFAAQLQRAFPCAADGERAHFLGVRAEIEELLPEFTLLAHPARQEPLGRVLLEAAASGVPVVATAVGGTAEIFSPAAATAVLVPANYAGALAAGIRQVLVDPASAAARAHAARQRIAREFDLNTAACSLLGHYDAVLAGA